MATDSTLHLFGIRHHGPGSARSLRQALQDLQPDVLLIEGSPEAEPLLPLLSDPQMVPPVALLFYVPDAPQQAAYYPLAVFSPEWQAIQYGLQQQIPIRFMDLPQSHQLGSTEPMEALEDSEKVENETEPTDPDGPEPEADLTAWNIRRDPLLWLAQAAGHSDSERWWEQFVEQRQDSTDVFAGILTAMTTLRTAVETTYPPNPEQNVRDRREILREAYMRQTIRQAQKEGFQTIAVVCGAWHTPALLPPYPPAKTDAALLKGLPKNKVATTWIPWTYERLALQSGYGAGVKSPGWYHHLWTCSTQPAERWLVRVARLLRDQDLDASSASVIETVRMAETLAALRERPVPGLLELNEAVQAVLCFGDATPMKLIERQLMVGDHLGAVPETTPMVPLQQDLRRLQQRLRLKPEALDRELVLDLRKSMDLERSQLFHRLMLLEIPWGKLSSVSGKGTFKEKWILRWQPELELALIEAGRWGNTIAAAAGAAASHQATTATQLPQLTTLLETILLAMLPTATQQVMARLAEMAALTSDLTHLMGALPPLANILRYSDVRQTDGDTIAPVVEGLIARICIGLPGACASLDDDAAATMLAHIGQTHRAIKLLQQDAYIRDWQAALHRLANLTSLHGLISGHSCRLLLDEGQLDGTEAARCLSLALSIAVEPTHAATWIQGFLSGSGLVLLHDAAIWTVLDDWITNLTPEAFMILLPLLRRTFSTFTSTERRQMGEKVRQGRDAMITVSQTANLDHDRAAAVLPLMAQLLGLEMAL